MVCFLGCGGSAQIGRSGEITATGSEEPASPPDSLSPSQLGWSIRDTTPYSRTEHATVLDEARDRMIVVGGEGGLDVWALPLSGPDKQRWTQIRARGNAPPASEVNTFLAISAVFDPFAQRLLVLRADSAQYETPHVWQLTLDDAPTWCELTVEGPSPGAELDQGKMVVDRSGKRVLVVGGSTTASGTWALTLDEPARWSRVTDAPTAGDFADGPSTTPRAVVLCSSRVEWPQGTRRSPSATLIWSCRSCFPIHWESARAAPRRFGTSRGRHSWRSDQPTNARG